MCSQIIERLSSLLGGFFKGPNKDAEQDGKKSYFGNLIQAFKNSPVGSNVAFGFILTGLEKLVELEFECPCNPTWNGVFSSAFFIVPAVMAFTMMLIIQGCRCNKKCGKTFSLSSFVPVIVWLILMFLDGQYFACAATTWNGKFVLVEVGGKQKWCEPVSKDVAKKEELMLRSRKLFVFSQVIGMLFLIPIVVSLIVYLIRESCCEDKTTKTVDDTANLENGSQQNNSEEGSLQGSPEEEGPQPPVTSPLWG